ncbi:MAG: hypothetical protein J6J24_03095 [Clostridia bacterium]|nr:hypothetical protein [Clostridia bacterium]
MEYIDFTKRDKAFNKFVEYRKKIIASADKGNFDEVFADIYAKAMSGNCVAQDCVAYFFNKGVPDFLYPNYDYYMCWQILAGANGNEFALEKLQFFLEVGLNSIIYDEEVLTTAMIRKNITKENALKVISNLICEGIVDELNIDPKQLIDIPNKAMPYSPEKNRKFILAMENCLERVAEYLVS